MVNTKTTRGLDDEDYATLIRVHRAISGRLDPKKNPDDAAFLQRYPDMEKACPVEKGGVWFF